MGRRIRPDEMAAEIAAELRQYSREVAEGIKEDVKEVAKECVKDIKAKSPVKTGEYKKGWRQKTEYEGENDIRIRIYNSKKPRLAHLLEFGHTIKGGMGRVEGKKHIYPAQESAAEKLSEKAKVRVRRR